MQRQNKIDILKKRILERKGELKKLGSYYKKVDNSLN